MPGDQQATSIPRDNTHECAPETSFRNHWVNVFGGYDSGQLGGRLLSLLFTLKKLARQGERGE